MSSFLDTVIIDRSRSERIRENYDNADCQQVSSRISHDVGMVFGESRVLPDSGLTAQQVNMVVGEIRYTPLTEELANDWNQGALCEQSDYSMNSPTVVPLGCVESLGAGDLFGLWATNGNVLYFGNNPADALVAEERTGELNYDSPFVRQE